jgi:hypothetical protein
VNTHVTKNMPNVNPGSVGLWAHEHPMPECPSFTYEVTSKVWVIDQFTN